MKKKGEDLFAFEAVYKVDKKCISNQTTEPEFQPHQSKEKLNLFLDLSNVNIWFTFVEYLFVKPDYVIPCFCNFS